MFRDYSWMFLEIISGCIQGFIYDDEVIKPNLDMSKQAPNPLY